MPETAERIDYTEFPAYGQGVDAFRAGSDEDECPHPPQGGCNHNRIAWFNGFFDQRTGSRLRGPFQRLGIVWP